MEITMSHDEKSRIINEAFAIGNDVRFFVHDTEVLETELKAGHQYSIYPRKFERVPDESVQTREKTLPLRTEGPMINLQWILLSESGASILLPVSVKVPEEISLAQLWHRHIANRVKRHVDTVRRGKHFRGTDEIEDGRVTEFQNPIAFMSSFRPNRLRMDSLKWCTRLRESQLSTDSMSGIQ
jgi:hypothetical protein